MHIIVLCTANISRPGDCSSGCSARQCSTCELHWNCTTHATQGDSLKQGATKHKWASSFLTSKMRSEREFNHRNHWIVPKCGRSYSIALSKVFLTSCRWTTHQGPHKCFSTRSRSTRTLKSPPVRYDLARTCQSEIAARSGKS